MQTLLDTDVRRYFPAVPSGRDDADMLCVLGEAALRNGRHDVAAALFVRALRRQPRHVGMRRHLVRALLGGGRFAQLLPQADAVLARTPHDAEMHVARGIALRALGYTVAACAAFNRATAPESRQAGLGMPHGGKPTKLDGAEAFCRTAADTMNAQASRSAVAPPNGEQHSGTLATAPLRTNCRVTRRYRVNPYSPARL